MNENIFTDLKDKLVKKFKGQKVNAEEAKKILALEKELSSDKYLQFNPPLYRGESVEPDQKEFGVREIRKDRKPKDTPQIIHNLIEASKENSYPNKPSRSEVLFAAEEPFKEKLHYYGIPRIIFPNKNAKIFWFVNDPFQAFSDLEIFLNRSVEFSKSVILSSSNNKFKGPLSKKSLITYEDLKDCIKILNKYKTFKKLVAVMSKGKNSKHISKFFRSNFSKLENECHSLIVEINKKINKNLDIYYYFKTLAEIVRSIEEYFRFTKRYTEKEIKSDRSYAEIMIDGDSYLSINPDWFEKYFYWDKNRFKAKVLNINE